MGIIGGATIFALIIGIFASFNGRVTRREITRVIIEEFSARHSAFSIRAEG